MRNPTVGVIQFRPKRSSPWDRLRGEARKEANGRIVALWTKEGNAQIRANATICDFSSERVNKWIR
ncbi:MAG: hypothetical protein CL921_01480 [Deltaproteobacteria bacterium]|nr:hypothetical protein [Deltaproteobacteria bacterium]